MSQIYLPELELNKTIFLNLKPPFWALALSIINDKVLFKMHIKRDYSNFILVNFRLLHEYFPRSHSHVVIYSIAYPLA